MRLTERAHMLVAQRLTLGAWSIDATVGNGFDTAFLAQRVGPTGHVFAFDVQPRAIEQAKLRVAGDADRVTFHLSGHEQMAARVPAAAHGRIAAVMFNLGYLPGGEKALVTRASTTLAALNAASELVTRGGIITVMVYRGHEGGNEEAARVIDWAATVAPQWAVERYDAASARDDKTPFLLAAVRC